MIKNLFFADYSEGFKVVEVPVEVESEKEYFYGQMKYGWKKRYKKKFMGSKYFLTARACAEYHLLKAIDHQVEAHKEQEAIEKWMDENTPDNIF